MITLSPYSANLSRVWDEAVLASRNGIFQHMRGYMDYHSDRFTDCSLIASDARGHAVAVLPAHYSGDRVYSHRGLSFGGWLMTPRADMNMMMDVWSAMTDHFRSCGFKSMYYRPSPHVYHTLPSEEDLYALYRAGGRLAGCQVSSVVDLSAPLGYDSNARRGLKTAYSAGVVARGCDDYHTFWTMLEACLSARHGAKPVHTLGEIMMLHDRFPDNIRLYGSFLPDGTMAGGVVMYYTRTDAHCQYIATTDAGREYRVLPQLFEYIMEESRLRGLRWFDFGTSCEEGGLILNSGLVRQKCGFGGRAVVYNAYEVDF